ncbi:MAG: hypothetical protein H6581_08095 [Bacteroidia bacterium]|nr:hypothetical protein [Bacteroidia bacterium]
MKPILNQQKPTIPETHKVVADLDDMVFEDRNKAYGSYSHRKETGIRHFNAVLLGGLVFAAVIWGLSMMEMESASKSEDEHNNSLNLSSLESLGKEKKNLKTVSYNGSGVDGYNPVNGEGYDLKLNVSSEAALLDMSGKDVADWEMAYNLTEGKKLATSLQLTQPVTVDASGGSVKVKVWVDESGKIGRYEILSESPSELESALASTLTDKQLPRLVIDGKATPAVVELSLHYAI